MRKFEYISKANMAHVVVLDRRVDIVFCVPLYKCVLKLDFAGAVAVANYRRLFMVILPRLFARTQGLPFHPRAVYERRSTFAVCWRNSHYIIYTNYWVLIKRVK